MAEKRILPLPELDETPVDPKVAVQLQHLATRWWQRIGNEQQLSQHFLVELCEALGTAKPGEGELPPDEYSFEKRIVVDGIEGRIDLFKKGFFVLEAKCGRTKRDQPGSAPVRDTPAWRRYLERAFLDQARIYAYRLEGGPPPLVIVVDVGRGFWIWRHDGNDYGGFDSPHRITISFRDLGDEDVARVLLACFEDPSRLDPRRHQARITRKAVKHLAEIAQTLDSRFDSEEVAKFLMRCLFCMFAEDIGLLEPMLFSKLLQEGRKRPANFRDGIAAFFRVMENGGMHGFERIPHFNGALFQGAEGLDLTSAEIDALADASTLRWDRVDPAIFGTLLVRALDPKERRRLGAHYTPRAYVERLVHACIEVPLRREWELVLARIAAMTSDSDTELELAKKRRAAATVLNEFRLRLANVRVLDPACGTANFLYVAYATVKALEHEVLETLRVYGAAQDALALEGAAAVVPEHFIGLEIKPWAAEIAQLVLWIGHLQWVVAHRGRTYVPEPILSEQRSIRCRDALITWEERAPHVDGNGIAVRRWDRETFILSPSTGEEIPDPQALVQDEHYVGVERAAWPEAEFIIGNPPFIGNKPMRERLGEGYVKAVRKAYDDVPDTVDFVMYWWHRAAELVRTGKATRFALITTNSITQAFNRQVTTAHLSGDPPLKLVMAVADQPWVDEKGSAAVRIAMSVGAAATDQANAELGFVIDAPTDPQTPVTLAFRPVPRIHADLTGGADITSVGRLVANAGLSFQGINLVGKGFVLSGQQAVQLKEADARIGEILKAYIIGRDIVRKPASRFVIDTYGLDELTFRGSYPVAHQWLTDRVKPRRLTDKRPNYRSNWWLHGEERPGMRAKLARLTTYIATPRTSKHRVFVFVPTTTLPDCEVVAITLDRGADLAVLSSRVHTLWALSAGGRLGVGNDPRYNHTNTFKSFPFPSLTHDQEVLMERLGNELDLHRKRVTSAHPEITLTVMYNLLDKLRQGKMLTPKEQGQHLLAQTGQLRTIHDSIDNIVFEAYGWAPGASDSELKKRLVDLNKERQEEERRGQVRWVRAPLQMSSESMTDGTVHAEDDSTLAPTKSKKVTPASRGRWPNDPGLRVLEMLQVLEAANGSISTDEIRRSWSHARADQVLAILEALEQRRLIAQPKPDSWLRSRLRP